MIGDASRVDTLTSTVSPIGKRVSVLTGAESLPEATPALSQIASMGSNDAYAAVALQARKLLLQESLPSIEHRKKKVRETAMSLATSTDDAEAKKSVGDFLVSNAPMVDVLYPVLRETTGPDDESGLLELYARHMYRTFTLKGISRRPESRSLQFAFLNMPSEIALNNAASVRSITDLTRMVSSSNLNESSSSESSNSLTASTGVENTPANVVRNGVFAVIDMVGDLEDMARFEAIVSGYPQYKDSSLNGEGGPLNVLYFIVAHGLVGKEADSEDVVAGQCQRVLSGAHDLLKQADVRRVTFVFSHEPDVYFGEYSPPALFTYRYPEFKEDALYRHIEPSHAFQLDLNRVAGNFRVKNLGSRHTPTCSVHMYEATPKPSALTKDPKANKSPRIFARALSFMLDFSSASFERILVDALNSLDLISPKSKSDNHLFINLVSDFEKAVLDPVVVEQVVAAIMKRHGERVTSLGVVEVETRVVCRLGKHSPPIALRLVASNPTGYVNVLSTYIEAAGDQKRVFKLIGGTKASLASTGDSSWEGMNVTAPYPLTRPFDAQRKAALKASDTLYCYDLPALFEAGVEQQWLDAAAKGGTEVGMRAAASPLMVMYTTELVVSKKGGAADDAWTMKDYLAGNLELLHVNRGAGANNVGMVAWLMVLKTVEYPDVSSLDVLSFASLRPCDSDSSLLCL
jgi:acetyl-CoA carboxylase/biotin carboxylase 1